MTRLTYSPCPRCRSNGKDSRGDNLVNYPDGSGHCFSCGLHVFGSNANLLFNPSFAPRDSVNVGKSLLPADFSREVPATAWKWLLQFGMPWSYWKESCGYSEKEQRLVFRVGEPLAFSIGRYVGEPRDDHQPRKWHVWGDCHKHCHVLREPEAIGNSVVLVEDLISAAKVSHVTTAIPLFGTKIHPCHLYYLQNSNEDVVLWLDKDQEFNVIKQSTQLSALIGRVVHVVTTDADPKLLTIKDINENLEMRSNSTQS